MKMSAPYEGQTYYGQPVVKTPPYDWRIAAYIYCAGLGGSAQILSTLARLSGREMGDVVRNGRYLAVAGTILGTPLLVSDLKTPSRFYNMLRIFRPTSAMSIGSYILTGFGGLSTLTAMGQAAGGTAEKAATAVQLPAALAGAGMSMYTASLLSGTNGPLWAATPRALAVQFGAAAMANAAAALSLAEQKAGRSHVSARLDAVATLALATELAASVVAKEERQARGVAGPLEEGKWAKAYKYGALALGVAVPLACHAANLAAPPGRKKSRSLSILGSLAVLAGGMVLRQAVLQAGNESLKRPADYLRFTQPKAGHWDERKVGSLEGRAAPPRKAAISASEMKPRDYTTGPRRAKDAAP
ncbi:NrfD/PsrC family molybdoenzyme membrane anchor subunit [Telmatospirillum sp. J64-1]|uniref:NrfD/PsrC family molybdoenzyme membrane anchor subunit n=1 Tax=Telmatospirillum sp. J64-1 TaxID=2502183 RepID=UPI00115E0DA3|nr:NrfD/PsrC family molybdoenzyme membrane anchor subunit [Telmatospirillum sp. J64-1]